MAFSEAYRRQVALLVRTLPLVARESCFALKGGTAINLFVRDLPRLSVDIDLTYLPLRPRDESLREIALALSRIGTDISRQIPGARWQERRDKEGNLTKIIVRTAGAQVMLEVNPVIRGCVNEPGLRTTSKLVQDEFGFAETLVVSPADLYAGKIMAALDRQHPRDLFDVRDLLANEGIDHSLRISFIVYLLSHSGEMHAVLNPHRKDIADDFRKNFDGMTSVPVQPQDLFEAREALIRDIVGRMPTLHREFLLSFVEGAPEWEKLDCPHAQNLPAVRYRMDNLAKVSSAKRAELVQKLAKVLNP